MTDDASPENLRKFLESDDPAMVRMGLSIAKGSGVPDELLPTILGLYMWDDDKSVRAAARTMFFKHAPAEIQAKVKENWKPSYRTLSITGERFQEAVRPFLEAFKSQDDFAGIAIVSLINALGDEGNDVRYAAAWALGKTGNERAVEPLIRVLSDDDPWVSESAIRALGVIGDERAVEPLIKALGDEDANAVAAWWGSASGAAATVGRPPPPRVPVRESAAGALGKIGDARAVEPLIKALRDDNEDVCSSAAEALGQIGDARAVEPLINALRDNKRWVRQHAADALGQIGDARAVEPLINALGDNERWVCQHAAEALGVIGDARAVEPLIGVLSSRSLWPRKYATKALGMIGDKRAVEPFIELLGYKNSDERETAARVLVKITEANIKGKEKENVLRFLESDDPAMVRMGASMLKGILEK